MYLFKIWLATGRLSRSIALVVDRCTSMKLYIHIYKYVYIYMYTYIYMYNISFQDMACNWEAMEEYCPCCV